MSTEPTPQIVRRSPRWVKLVLALSLALNLAIIGLVAGAITRGGPRHATSVNYALPYVLALPGADRRAVFRAMRQAERGERLPDRKARRALHAEMLVALRADPYDPAQVRAILDRLARVSLDVQDVAQTNWLARIGAMSAEDRASYAYRVEEILRRGPRKPDRDGRAGQQSDK